MLEVGRWLLAGLLGGVFVAIINPHLSGWKVSLAVMLLLASVALVQQNSK
jgi:hypothetical protein